MSKNDVVLFSKMLAICSKLLKDVAKKLTMLVVLAILTHHLAFFRKNKILGSHLLSIFVSVPNIRLNYNGRPQGIQISLR